MKRVKNLRDLLQNEEEVRLLFALEITPLELQMRICLELGRRKSKSAVKPLQRRLASNDAAIREAAAEALGKIGEPSVGEDLLKLFADKNQPVAVRDTCAYALARLAYRPALPKLLSALADPAPSVRACVIAALAAIGLPEVRQLVELALETESDPTVRQAMASLLKNMRTPDLTIPAQLLPDKSSTNQSLDAELAGVPLIRGSYAWSFFLQPPHGSEQLWVPSNTLEQQRTATERFLKYQPQSQFNPIDIAPLLPKPDPKSVEYA